MEAGAGWGGRLGSQDGYPSESLDILRCAEPEEGSSELSAWSCSRSDSTPATDDSFVGESVVGGRDIRVKRA